MVVSGTTIDADDYGWMAIEISPYLREFVSGGWMLEQQWAR